MKSHGINASRLGHIKAVRDAEAYEHLMEIIDTLTCLPKLAERQQRYLDTLSALADAYEAEAEPWDS